MRLHSLTAPAIRLVLPVFALACATIPPEPVELVGPHEQLAALQGRWTGYYETDSYGRYGFIEMNIFAEGDSARGDVIMTYQRKDQPDQDPVNARPHSRVEHQLLAIRFVRAADGVISGFMAPYRDPECGCRVATTFVGGLSGNVIEGTFRTRHLDYDHANTTGKWRVTRQPIVTREGTHRQSGLRLHRVGKSLWQDQRAPTW